eukprot:5540386-Prymnesium_polylepis.1
MAATCGLWCSGGNLSGGGAELLRPLSRLCVWRLAGAAPFSCWGCGARCYLSRQSAVHLWRVRAPTGIGVLLHGGLSRPGTCANDAHDI